MGEAVPIRADSSIILFAEGIIGVPRARRFQLLEKAGSPFRVLRCLDIEGFALPVIDPRLVDPAYRPKLGSRLGETLSLSDEDPVVVLAVATVSPDGPVANLRAPIVINARDRVAAQVILDDRHYPLRAPVDVASAESEDASEIK
jgi:flagellar assembly factor FliW